MGGLSDEALLAGLAVGDVTAAAGLVGRYQRRVYGLALSILGDPAAAEDAAQEAFLRAWRFAETYDPRRGTAAAWLLTLTRNTALDALRAHGRRPVLVTDPAALGELGRASAEPDPAQASVAAEESRRLWAAVAALPTPQRRAVLLASWHGATAAQIAEMEGIPVGTAKTRIRGGMLRLRATLAPARGES